MRPDVGGVNVSRHGDSVTYQAGRLVRARRAQAALLSNAVSSLGNLVLAVAIARNGSVKELGEFAVAFSVYALVTGLARASVTESVLGLAREPHLIRQSASQVSMVAVACAVLVVAMGLVLKSPYLTIAGVCLPGAAVYDYVKAISLGVGRVGMACIQETTWTLLTAAVALPALFHAVSGLLVFACWAASCAAIGYVAASCLGYRVFPRWSADRRETTLALTFGLDFLAGSGSAQLTTSVLAGATGTAVVGAIRAAGTALGPASLLVGTARSMAIPYLARSRTASTHVRLRTALILTGLLLLLASPIAVAVTCIPDVVGRTALGSNWSVAKPLLPALACELMFSVATTVAFSGHRVHRAAGRTLAIRVISAPVRVFGVVGGGRLFGAQGAAVAMATVALLGAALWWWSYVKLLGKEAVSKCP